MLSLATTNDNNSGSRLQSATLPQRVPDYFETEIWRLQTEAECASLDGLAYILAIAAREANRMAEWERRVRAELNRRSGEPTVFGGEMISQLPAAQSAKADCGTRT